MDQPVIRMQFPDGLYSFWAARKPDGTTQAVFFRVKENGKGAWHTPQQRMKNLMREVIRNYDPESVKYYREFTKFRPADLTQITAWLMAHGKDLQEFIAPLVKYGPMTKRQKAAMKGN